MGTDGDRSRARSVAPPRDRRSAPAPTATRRRRSSTLVDAYFFFFASSDAATDCFFRARAAHVYQIPPPRPSVAASRSNSKTTSTITGLHSFFLRVVFFCVRVEELGRAPRAYYSRASAPSTSCRIEYHGINTTRAEEDDGKEREKLRAFPSPSAINHHILASNNPPRRSSRDTNPSPSRARSRRNPKPAHRRSATNPTRPPPSSLLLVTPSLSLSLLRARLHVHTRLYLRGLSRR